MNEFPIFIPHGSGHLAGVLTVPDRAARGVVLLLTGGGIPQVTGSTLCTRAAARLAQDDLASVRIDYEGIGDSTGILPYWSLVETAPPLAQAEAALAVAVKAVGATQFAVIGSCIGSRVALQLARQLNCAGAVCIASPLIQPRSWTRIRRRSRRFPLLTRIRRNRVVSYIVVRPLRRVFGDEKAAPGLLEGLRETLGHARVLFLYTESLRDHYTPRTKTLLDATISALDAERCERFELRILPTTRLTGFDTLPADEQALIIDQAVEWISDAFCAREEAADPVADPVAPSTTRAFDIA